MKILVSLVITASLAGCASDGKTNTTAVKDVCFTTENRVFHSDGLDIGSERYTDCNGIIRKR